MSEWSLDQIFKSMHSKIEEDLRVAREALQHSGTKGAASETVWLRLLETYLPKRYQVCSGHVVDSEGVFSDQIDIIIFDRQYSPFIFEFMGANVVPAESIYGVFEAKQTLNSDYVAYARSKVKSVRQLKRTSLPIPTADGMVEAKELHWILGGILSLDSDWSPSMGESLLAALGKESSQDTLDLGCVSTSGIFSLTPEGTVDIRENECATTLFLFDLIKRLQMIATVPMIDIDAYAKWLDK